MRAGIDDLSDLPGVVIGVSRGRPDADDATRSRTERAKQPAPRMAARQFHSPAQLLGVLNCLLDRRFWVSWSGHRRILRLTVDKCQANPIFFVFRPLFVVHCQLSIRNCPENAWCSSARARSVMFRYPSICAMCVSLNAVTTLGSTITN